MGRPPLLRTDSIEQVEKTLLDFEAKRKRQKKGSLLNAGNLQRTKEGQKILERIKILGYTTNQVLSRLGRQNQIQRSSIKYYWRNNNELINEKIRQWNQAGANLRATAMNKSPGERKSLYYHVVRELRIPWRKKIKELKINLKPEWYDNFPEIEKLLREMHKNGTLLHTSAASVDKGLLNDIYQHITIKHETNWRDYLYTVFGEEAENITKHPKYSWRGSKKRLINRVEELRRTEHDISPKTMIAAGGEKNRIVWHAYHALKLPYTKVQEIVERRIKRKK